jgi:hypothetical protein
MLLSELLARPSTSPTPIRKCFICCFRPPVHGTSFLHGPIRRSGSTESAHLPRRLGVSYRTISRKGCKTASTNADRRTSSAFGNLDRRPCRRRSAGSATGPERRCHMPGHARPPTALRAGDGEDDLRAVARDQGTRHFQILKVALPPTIWPKPGEIDHDDRHVSARKRSTSATVNENILPRCTFCLRGHDCN